MSAAEPAYHKHPDGTLAPGMSYERFLERTNHFVLRDLDNCWSTGNGYKDGNRKLVPAYVTYALANADRKLGVGHPFNADHTPALPDSDPKSNATLKKQIPIRN